MKPLTSDETRLKEEMKARCLAKGEYTDENAKAKFDMLCHLENFEIQYWKLQEENKRLNGAIQTYDILLKSNIEENKQLKERIAYLERSNDRREDDILEQRQEIIDSEKRRNKLKEYLNEVMEHNLADKLESILDKMQELEQGSDSND